ncbi:TPA: histidine phosphatase family protein [Candidatus Woesearchaeota archaeon]|uniref:Phosphoglycerate mutase n=1 Tax=Candidatus Falkowbacteria bacterium GW2011_GWA2_39_24 TaxID=1618634 RepID=A0A0G0NPE0_9BACT|nr:MAG: Phosphoglycerate mutase [Candidatus Falkowbacteria bacterium GW2011_GWA2_39_24]HIH32175.1 histidine phosphatase family protein [Candidatus Woesearchaeota archaeon]HIJ13722.1 histidine phosphatase family protein [Candidatus Woesearchaeota archaeon]
MILILIRHGKAEGEGDATLSLLGIEQAKAAAKKLSTIPITKAYSSNYARALGTYEEYKIHNPQVSLTIYPDLKEIYRFIVGGPVKEGTRPNRVEEDTARAEKAFNEILKNDKDEVIAIFSHGNMIRYFLSKALKVDPKCMWEGVTLNCGSISVIQIKNGKMNVKLINGIDHLPHRDIKGFYSKHEDTTYLP